MFKSLGQTLASFRLQTPQRILASLIAKSLSEFFVVDQDAIQSNLTSGDTSSIILRDVRLKPRKNRIGTHVVASIDGTVTEVYFSWTWSFTGSTGNNGATGGGMIQNAALAIKGLNFEISLSSWEDADEDTRLTCIHSNKTAQTRGQDDDNAPNIEKNSCENDGFLQKYMQQVIDHLTLHIVDVKFTIVIIPCSTANNNEVKDETGVLLKTNDTTASSRTHKSSIAQTPIQVNPQVAKFVLDGKYIRLVTKIPVDSGSTTQNLASTSRHLSQEISFECISAHIIFPHESPLMQDLEIPVHNKESEASSSGTRYNTSCHMQYPLIEPFDYKASIVRLSGKRFVDGIGNGLQIVGQRSDDIDEFGSKLGITFHAGLPQAKALSLLADMTMPNINVGGSRNEVSQNSNDENVNKYDGLVTEEDDSCSDFYQTSFILPLPSLNLILSTSGKSTTLTIPLSVLHYQMDGTLFSIIGDTGSGILIDKKPLIDIHSNGRWIFDFGLSQLILEMITENTGVTKVVVGEKDHCHTVASKPLATIFFDEDKINHFMSVFQEIISGVLANTMERGFNFISEHSTPSSRLSLRANDNIDFCFQGGSKTKSWMKASVMSPTFTISFNVPSSSKSLFHEFKCDGINIGPCSFGKFSTIIPQVHLSKTGDFFEVKGPIMIDMQSHLILFEMPKKLNRLFRINPKESSQLSLPFDVEIPKINLTIEEYGLQLHVTKLKINTRLEISCEEANMVQGKKGRTITMKGINSKLAWLDSVSIQIKSIAECRLPGIMTLIKVANNTSIRLRKGILHIQTCDIHADLSNEPPPTKGVVDDVSVTSSLPISIPIPICIGASNVFLNRNNRTTISVCHTSLNVSLLGPMLQINAQHALKVKLENSRSEWIEASLDSLGIELNLDNMEDTRINHFHCNAGAIIGSCSFGQCSLQIPEVNLIPDTMSFVLNGEVFANCESLSVAQNLQALVEHALLRETADLTIKNKTCVIPLGARMVEFRFEMQNPKISMTMKDVNIEYGCSKEGNDTSTQHVVVPSNAHPKLDVDISSVETLLIPGVLQLSSPIYDMSVSFRDKLSVRIPEWCVEILTGKQNLPQTDSCGSVNISLPFAVDLTVDALLIKQASNADTFSARLQNVHAEVSENVDVFTTEIKENIYICVNGPSASWISAYIKPSSVSGFLDKKSGMLKTRSALFSGAKVDGCSFGFLEIDIPAITFDSLNSKFCVDNSISAVVGSIKILAEMKDFVMNFTTCNSDHDKRSTGSTEHFALIPFTITQISIGMLEPKVTVLVKKLSSSENQLVCQNLRMNDLTGHLLSVQGISFNMQSKLQCRVEMIDNLRIPGVCRLHESLCNASFTLADDNFYFVAKEIHLINLPGVPEQEHITQHEMTFPFTLKVILDEIHLTHQREQGFDLFKINGLDAEAKIAEFQQRNNDTCPIYKGVGIKIINIDTVRHKMIHAENVSAAFNINLSRLEDIHEANIVIERATLSAGYSSIDWSNIIGGKNTVNNLKPLNMPYALISSIKLAIGLKGVIVSTNSVIDIKPFNGNGITSSEDLIQYYKNAVLERVPGLLTNAELLGTNSAYIVGASAGRAIMNSKVAGSVMGVVASDGIKGAIRLGKQNRGVAIDDRYKFGDFTRGSYRALANAKKVGAARTIKGTEDYCEENKIKLSGAAGGSIGASMGITAGASIGYTVGSVVGCAALGVAALPVGLVAGAYYGKKIGEDMVSDGTKSQGDDGNSTREAVNTERNLGLRDSNDQDLLGIGGIGSNHTGSNRQQESKEIYTAFSTSDNHQMFNTIHTSGVQHPNPPIHTQNSHSPSSPKELPQKKGYRFGDLTKKVIAKGSSKRDNGGDGSYKFGDFTRGLFS